jgi:hypothetical protein
MVDTYSTALRSSSWSVAITVQQGVAKDWRRCQVAQVSLKLKESLAFFGRAESF